MLQEFLNANLLPITDEGHFEKLIKASNDIAKKLSKNKAKILTYTFVALDPEIPADNIELNEVKDLIIKKYWSTFLTNTNDTPKTFIRAVMLEALKVVSKEIDLACLIWFAGRNVQKYYNIVGKEQELIGGFLTTLGERIETIASENWALQTESKYQKVRVEPKDLPVITINREILQKRLEDASGPNNEQGTPNYESPNPHWPNTANPWSYAFAPRAAVGIADVVNRAFKTLSNESSVRQTDLIDSVKELIVNTQNENLEKNSLLQMRAQLLWWKESCYSKSLNQSYRELQNGMLQLILAVDYSAFIPAIHPASVDYFLLETHREIVEGENQKMKASEIVKLIEQSSQQLRTVFTEPDIEQGRLSLLCFIKGLVWGKYSSRQFKKLLGFPSNTEITLSEFALWLFHDLQSVKISTTK